MKKNLHSNSALQYDFNILGINNFKVVILECIENKKNRMEKEKQIIENIRKINIINVYNGNFHSNRNHNVILRNFESICPKCNNKIIQKIDLSRYIN